MTVCVATYRRPEGLRRLLASLDELVFDDPAPDVRVVIVDNDPDGPAVDVRSERWPTTVLHEPQPGIPFARNRAVKKALEAESDWLAFVDDDETVAPDWLDQLLRCAHRTGAPMVTGPVLSHLPPDAPRWARGGAFERPSHADGEPLKLAKTGNLLIHREVFDALDTRWFDERLADVGGSDSELTGRARRDGARIVWCQGAVATEHVPPERVSVGWVIRRGYRVGTTRGHLLRVWDHVAFREQAHRALVGLTFLARGLLMTLAGGLWNRSIAVRGLKDAATGVGMLAGLLGRTHDEYAR